MIIKVTCQTENCNNRNHAISLENPAQLVTCGVCGQEILDKKEVKS
jgi:ribosomal protein S27E